MCSCASTLDANCSQHRSWWWAASCLRTRCEEAYECSDIQKYRCITFMLQGFSAIPGTSVPHSDVWLLHSVTLTSCHPSNKAQSNLTACFSALSHPSPQISTLKAVTWHYCYCVLLIPASHSLSLVPSFSSFSLTPPHLSPTLSLLLSPSSQTISCGLSWVTWLILFTGHMALSQPVRGRKKKHTKKRILGVSLISWYQTALPPHHPRQHHCLSLVMWRERLGERFLQPHYSVIL